MNDLKFALRQLLKNPGFTAVAVLALALGRLGDKPLVILSHSSKFRLDPNLPEEVALRLDKVCQELQADLKCLSSHSTLRQSANGGHHLQVDDPALVIAGIRQVLDAVNQKTK